LSFDDCVKFANANPSGYLATVDGDQPRVRGLLLWFADQTGFYFSTVATKDLYKQLKANPKVELCFFDPKTKNMQMMRVTGKVEFQHDIETKKRLIDARPFLKQWGLTPESPGLIVFRVGKGEAFFWSIDKNMEPKQFIKFG
jgi:pyridoxamine 5'-phosphate oxidase